MLNSIINPGPSRASYHTLARAARCLRSYFIAKELEREGNVTDIIPNAAMQAGTLIHVGLAHMYASVRAANPILVNGIAYTDAGEYLDWKDAVCRTATEINYQGEILSILVTLETYKRVIASNDKHQWDLLSIETEYGYRLDDVPEHMSLRTQRADLVIQDKVDGKIYIVDHKKVWRLSAKTEEQFLPHGQFIGYSIIGYRHWGKQFGGVILNRVCLQGQGQGPRFDRTTISHSRDTIKAFILSMKDTIQRVNQYKDIHWSKVPGVFDEQVCRGKYEPCPYMDICIGHRR